MNQTVSIPETTVNRIIETLLEVKQEVKRLVEKMESLEPSYGSDEWWEWSDKKALRSIREGKGIVIRNKQQLDTFFKSL